MLGCIRFCVFGVIYSLHCSKRLHDTTNFHCSDLFVNTTNQTFLFFHDPLCGPTILLIFACLWSSLVKSGLIVVPVPMSNRGLYPFESARSTCAFLLTNATARTAARDSLGRSVWIVLLDIDLFVDPAKRVARTMCFL